MTIRSKRCSLTCSFRSCPISLSAAPTTPGSKIQHSTGFGKKEEKSRLFVGPRHALPPSTFPMATATPEPSTWAMMMLSFAGARPRGVSHVAKEGRSPQGLKSRVSSRTQREGCVLRILSRRSTAGSWTMPTLRCRWSERPIAVAYLIPAWARHARSGLRSSGPTRATPGSDGGNSRRSAGPGPG